MYELTDYSMVILVVAACLLLANRIKHTDRLYEERHQRIMERLDELDLDMIGRFEELDRKLNELTDENKWLMFPKYYEAEINERLENIKNFDRKLNELRKRRSED